MVSISEIFIKRDYVADEGLCESLKVASLYSLGAINTVVLFLFLPSDIHQALCLFLGVFGHCMSLLDRLQ